MRISEKRIIKNLTALEKRYPGMKKLIEDKKEELLGQEAVDIWWEEALNGEMILKVRRENRSLYLAGRRDPGAPAVNQIGLLGKIVPNAPILIVGMGNLHYLKELLDKADDSVVILLYEPIFSVFYKQLEIIDIDELFQKRLIALIVEGINGEELQPFLRDMLKPDRIPLMKSFTLPNYEELALEKIRDFYKAAKELTAEYSVNLHTKIYFNRVVADNFYHNVNYIRTGYKASQLYGALPKDIPAIVVAAGPSLNKNIRELKRAKNRAFIIAVDTAIKPLLKEGIVPDMFAMLDGKKPLHLVETEAARQIPLLALATGAREILDYHTGKKFFVSEGYSYIAEMFSMNEKRLERLSYGGSVATLAFSLACNLDFPTVIMVGQDLAYTGNKSHADGTFQEKMEEKDTANYLMVPGNYEEKVPTMRNLDSYRRWFESFIAYWKESHNVRFVNATEGGAKIEGTELLTLREAIDQECSGETDIAACIEKLEPAFDKEEQEKILEYFHNTPKRIHDIILLAREGKRWYQKLDKLCRNGNVDKRAYVKLLTRIKKNRKNIEKNENYQIISETMVYAEQILMSSQYFNYETMEEEGRELARQGRLFMELLEECAGIMEELAKETVARI